MTYGRNHSRRSQQGNHSRGITAEDKTDPLRGVNFSFTEHIEIGRTQHLNNSTNNSTSIFKRVLNFVSEAFQSTLFRCATASAIVLTLLSSNIFATDPGGINIDGATTEALRNFGKAIQGLLFGVLGSGGTMGLFNGVIKTAIKIIPGDKDDMYVNKYLLNDKAFEIGTGLAIGGFVLGIPVVDFVPSIMNQVMGIDSTLARASTGIVGAIALIFKISQRANETKQKR